MKVLSTISAILAVFSTVAVYSQDAGVEPRTSSGLRKRKLTNDGKRRRWQKRLVWNFLSNLNSGQETKPCASGAFGVAYAYLTDSTFCVSVSFFPLSSAWTKAHFHGPAGPGEDGGILIDYSDSVDLSKNYFKNCSEVDPATEREIKSGLTYFNMHSASCDSGEIRGQILPISTSKVRIEKKKMTAGSAAEDNESGQYLSEVMDIFQQP